MAAVCLLAGGRAGADTVQVAPFAGFQFGGSFQSDSGREVSLESGLDYGGTIDVRIDKSWSVEGLYSRQTTVLGPGFDVTVERLMGGIVEEQGEGASKFFGVILLGATRLKPARSGYGSDSNFTIGLSLGVKHLFSPNVGFRAEARGFYAITESGGGVFCANGVCLFAFKGSGLTQADVSGGFILAF